MAVTRAVPASLFDSLFSDPFLTSAFRPARPVVRRVGPAVRRADGRVVVSLDVPGLRAEDLDVSVTADGDGAVVSVHGERRDARGTRDVRWSARLHGVDPDAVTGDLTDGVLTIVAPEVPAPVVRRVELSTGAAPALDAAADDLPAATEADGSDETSSEADEPA